MKLRLIPSFAPNPRLAIILLQSSLVFCFAYAAITAFTDPEIWLGFIPAFVPETLRKPSLDAFSVIQLILAAWILSGQWLRYAALASGLVLVAITVTDLSLLPVTFRDFGLAAGAFALALIVRPGRRQ